jgi:N-formylglutamate deformylase
VVLGDMNGSACAPHITEAVLHAFERRGFSISVNDPYAGGYTTQRYGRPLDHIHVLQIELDRTLYMDELRIKPHGGFVGLRESLTAVLAELAEIIPELGLGGAQPNFPMAAE